MGVVTALLPHIGYKKCTEAAAMAVKATRGEGIVEFFVWGVMSSFVMVLRGFCKVAFYVVV